MYYEVLILLTTIWHEAYTNQCIFSTAHNLKAPNISVIESHIVENFYNDCEFLCYTNPDRCIAANVVRREDNTYSCEFVSVKVSRDYLSLLESNPDGKYISRNAGMCSQ